MTATQKGAADAAITAKRDEGFGSIEFDGKEYGIVRKPNTLLLAELARTSSGDPEAMGVFAEFFEVTLGDNYRGFKRDVFRSDAADDESVLMGLLQDILEKTLGRPTE